MNSAPYYCQVLVAGYLYDFRKNKWGHGCRIYGNEPGGMLLGERTMGSNQRGKTFLFTCCVIAVGFGTVPGIIFLNLLVSPCF